MGATQSNIALKIQSVFRARMKEKDFLYNYGASIPKVVNKIPTSKMAEKYLRKVFALSLKLPINMKESERLRKEAQAEDNDFKAMSIHKKASREAKLKNWHAGNYVEGLKNKDCLITESLDGTKITTNTQSEIGILDYFPKSNKLLIRKKNEWKPYGLKWIKENLLK